MHIAELQGELENQPGIYYLKDGSLFLTKRPQLPFEKNFKSQEVHLKDLGKFPIDEKHLPLLEQVWEYHSKKLMVPEILKKSQIPLFYAIGPSLPVYIPTVAFPILRYFSVLWDRPSEGNEGLLTGFLILDSFVGGSA